MELELIWVVFFSFTGLTFEVIEGGFLDIDVRVLGPDNEEIITRERESNGKITFAASKTGEYHYCFSNKMSTMTPKGVMFSMDIGEPQAAPAEGERKFGSFCPTVQLYFRKRALTNMNAVRISECIDPVHNNRK